MSAPRAFERIEEVDGRTDSVLMAVDEAGEVELDRYPNEGEAAAEAEDLNANPDMLVHCIRHARNRTGPWARRGR